MFKNFLKDQVAGINNDFISVGSSGLLAVGVSGLNATLYSQMTTIMSSVIMPIAYVILAIFLGLELYHICDHSFADTSTVSIPFKLLFKLLIRILIAKLLVDNCLAILNAIYDVNLQIINGISSTMSGGSVSGGLDMVAINAAIDDMGLGEQIGMLPQILIVKFVVFICLGLVDVICIGRFVEIYIYIALAPIPMATLLSDELSDIGKNFLKSFTALALQGAVIYIAVSFFPTLVNANILGTDSTDFLSLVLYALVLTVTVIGSGRIAKSICHAT